ncbi:MULTISPECIES: hypothetical protein [unclassified Nonomuraea]|uniref:hypothetical protein n=1 Tax=unclassified Nonomuraea TaxID=2593643 RepID=UPI003407F67A
MPETDPYRFTVSDIKGMVKVILRVLEARGVALSDSDRERIATCGNVARLELWLDRVALVSTVEELFVCPTCKRR